MRAYQDGLSRRLEALIEKLPEQRQGPLRELLISLLEPALKLQAEHDSLTRLEEKYLIALKEDSSNVIDFRLPEKSDQPFRRNARRWLLKVPCLIEASSYGEVFRMAFELHLRSSRNIFLPWRDIDPGARHNAEVLSELTSCSIFIPDVTDVQPLEQKAILEVVRDGDSEKPHFMAGTYSPYSELRNLRGLDPDFLESMSAAYLKLTKPVSQYKREGLIRYFLESLS